MRRPAATASDSGSAAAFPAGRGSSLTNSGLAAFAISRSSTLRSVPRRSSDDGGVAGVYARETLPGDESATAAAGFVVRARHVVNATGVWAEQTERLDGETPTLQVAPSKGAHLVFTREALDLGDEAIVLPETEDGRIIFIVPWQSRALVGTTDNGVEQMETPVATEDDIDYLLGHLNHTVRRPLTRADIVSTYAS